MLLTIISNQHFQPLVILKVPVKVKIHLSGIKLNTYISTYNYLKFLAKERNNTSKKTNEDCIYTGLDSTIEILCIFSTKLP